jgi:extradiol dioxygenase family protein
VPNRANSQRRVDRKPARIEAVEQVQLEASVTRADELRWFYGELLGLTAVAGPTTDGLRFRSDRLFLHIRLSHHPQLEPIAVRAVLLVPSLAAAAESLAQREIPFVRMSGLNATERRLSLLDPGGNRVELKQAWPVAPL